MAARSRFVGIDVEGMREAQAVFRRLPKVARRHFNNRATEPTAKKVLQHAQRRVPVVHRVLRNHLDMSMSKATGWARVGVKRGEMTVHGRKHNPSKIAHLVEFGHNRGAGPSPFMIPAAERERQPYARRFRRAGDEIERQLKFSLPVG